MMQFDLLQLQDILALLFIGVLLGLPFWYFALRLLKALLSQLFFAWSVRRNFRRCGTLSVLAKKAELKHKQQSLPGKDYAALDELTALARETARAIKLKREDR